MTEKEKLIVNEAIIEFQKIMEVSPRRMAKDLVKSALGRSVRTRDPLFWPAGMLMLGLAETRKRAVLDSEKDIAGRIDEAFLLHIRLWKEKYDKKISYIDDALSGAALIRLYEQLEEVELKSQCKGIADGIYEYLLRAARDAEGTIVYNADRSACNVFADGIGQTSIFLSAYRKTFGVNEAGELARLQLKNFLKHGTDDKSGLPYHGYALLENGAVCEKKGVLSWGRAAGWLIMGLSEYVKSLGSGAEDADDSLVRWYRDLSKALLSYQKPEGGYSWQVQAVDGHLDTSATGMIVYGLLNCAGAEASEVESSLKALLKSADGGKVMSALSSCDDFGVHYQNYGAYPWGQGAALAALSLGCK